jgi:hypothetical protein
MQPLHPLTEDEIRRRRRRQVQPGEYIGFDMAFMDSASRTSTFHTDSGNGAAARAGLEQARKRWLLEKRTAYLGDRKPKPDDEPSSIDESAQAGRGIAAKFSDACANAGVNAARQARCARLENSWRGQ